MFNLETAYPDLGKHLAGPLGALVALLWLTGSWLRKTAMFMAGWALSYYGSPAAAEWLGFSEGFSGFLLGLFGMSIVDKIFEVWQSMEFGVIFKDWLRKKLGV